ncbi:hypothetical protein IM816_06150 [Luteibacter flocculans]|uniref:DUF3617 family protein n=1 Tax=Luteibacter flocculans TaxID=2780091 RepID=A0ABY4T632_9GAMM|nr:DUF6491 family protein [Luteibacter flocculans]URL59674.1 hypothetical protein IM816_06150 [Luteibacter flocculans]
MNVRYLLAASLLVTCAVQAQDARPQARQELPYADCLRTDQINEWNVIDDRTLTVRNGPNRFLVKTTVACPRMDLGGGVHFRASESDKAVGGMRICGGINEQIVRRDDPPCQIQSVEKIDEKTFDHLKKKAKRSGSGAEPNGMVH